MERASKLVCRKSGRARQIIKIFTVSVHTFVGLSINETAWSLFAVGVIVDGEKRVRRASVGCAR